MNNYKNGKCKIITVLNWKALCTCGILMEANKNKAQYVIVVTADWTDTTIDNQAYLLAWSGAG